METRIISLTQAVDFVQQQLNQVQVTGMTNVKLMADAGQVLTELRKALSKIEAAINEQQKKKEAVQLEQKKAEREQQLKEAADRGETVIGGETIRLNSDGTADILIP